MGKSLKVILGGLLFLIVLGVSGFLFLTTYNYDAYPNGDVGTRPPTMGGTDNQTASANGNSGSGRIHATRLFVGRDGFPPESFAAYGIVAFDTLATSEDEPLYIVVCEAFFSTLINSSDIAAPRSEQMVTVWPIDDRTEPRLTALLNTTRMGEDSCRIAVAYYDVQVARQAIDDAIAAGIPLSGRGPFLLAWAPAHTKGRADAIVLAADLGDVQTVADAKDMFRIWRTDIEGDPTLWQSGFSAEKLRVKIRQIVNRYGDGLLKFFGG